MKIFIPTYSRSDFKHYHRLIDFSIYAFALLLCSTTFAAEHPKLKTFNGNKNIYKIDISILQAEKKFKATKKSTTYSDQTTAKVIGTASHGNAFNILFNELNDAVIQQIKTFPQIKILHISQKYKQIKIEITHLSIIHTLADIPEVRRIMPALGGRAKRGITDSRAPQALKSDTASNTHSVDGAGQKIGIISDSFARTNKVRAFNTSPGYGVPGILKNANNQVSGDLPITLEIRNDSSWSNGLVDEGAAMAELIYDIAPGAALAFHTGIDGESIMAEAINDLCLNAKATIVVDDLAIFSTPLYQYGIIQQAAADCVAAGIPYFSAAGNQANIGIRQTYKDINEAIDDQLLLPSGNDLHDWGNGNGFLKLTLPPSAEAYLFLHWNQPSDKIIGSKGAQIDLDLMVTYFADNNELHNPIFSSNGLQGDTETPAGDAFESGFLYNRGTTQNVDVFIAIEHYRGNKNFIPQNSETRLEFSLLVFQLTGDDIIIETISDKTSNYGVSTIFGQAAIPESISVAAVAWWEAPSFDPTISAYGPPQSTVSIDAEAYSSRGGSLTIPFDKNGNFFPQLTYKPDFAAVTGNNTTFFGNNISNAAVTPWGEDDGHPNFFGTSAAAPNAAAIAALMLELNNHLTPIQIKTVLQGTATDVTGYRASVGIDDVTGHGLINAEAALNAVAMPPIANAGNDLQSVLINSMVQLDGTTSRDPEGHNLTYAWLQTAGDPVSINFADKVNPRLKAPNRAQTLIFELTVSDNYLLTSRDQVLVNIVAQVTPPNNSGDNNPNAKGDNVTTAEDTPVLLSNLLSNDRGIDRSTLSIANFQATSLKNGSVTRKNGNILLYTPALNFNGEDQFAYTISDGMGGLSTADVVINVSPVSDPPVAVNDTVSTNTSATPVIINVLHNDFDIDGSALTIQRFNTSSIRGGTITKNDNDTLTYTAPKNFQGEDNFTYTIINSSNISDQGKVIITLEGTQNNNPKKASFNLLLIFLLFSTILLRIPQTKNQTFKHH